MSKCTLALICLVSLGLASCAGSDDSAVSAKPAPDAGPSFPTAGAQCPASEELTFSCGEPQGGAGTPIFQCRDGVYEQAHTCPGFNECAAYAVGEWRGIVICGGVYYGLDGSPCAKEGRQVCSFDSGAVLLCKAGFWKTAIHCPPSECTLIPETSDDQQCSGHWCSNCGYTIGDMCEFGAGSVACSTDLKSIVQCANGTVVEQENCGSRNCTRANDNGATVIICQ